MIIVINTSGLTFRIPQKNIEVKTPARLRVSESMLLILLSELRKQSITDWYILSDISTQLKAPPKTMKNKFDKNKSNVLANSNNTIDCLKKLDEVIKLLKEIKNKEVVTDGNYNIKQTKKIKSQEQPDFIPIIDISDMEIKSTGLQTQKQDVSNNSINKAANAINDILGGK